MIRLIEIKRTSPGLLRNMSIHYSQPKGFVGRNICYSVVYDKVLFGHIVGGSATMHLPGRDDYFGIDKSSLNNIVNNIFYHIEKQLVEGNMCYPLRNFSTQVLLAFESRIQEDWYVKYGNVVHGLETLIELPRTGQCYKQAGWELIGQTIGYTCKRGPGQGTDNWSGARVWDTNNLRPKHVLVKKV